VATACFPRREPSGAGPRPITMRRNVLVAVVAVALVAAGAAIVVRVLPGPGDNSNGSVAVRDLASIAGEYVSINDTGAPAPVLDSTPVRLVVEAGRIRATAGCNSIQGQADVQDGRLVAPGLATTEMGCPADVAAQEEWVIAMLQSRPRLERSGPYLSLLWEDHWLGLSSDPVDRQAGVTPAA
jgi:heat shock protein HslJ